MFASTNLVFVVSAVLAKSNHLLAPANNLWFVVNAEKQKINHLLKITTQAINLVFTVSVLAKSNNLLVKSNNLLVESINLVVKSKNVLFVVND